MAIAMNKALELSREDKKWSLVPGEPFAHGRMFGVHYNGKPVILDALCGVLTVNNDFNKKRQFKLTLTDNVQTTLSEKAKLSIIESTKSMEQMQDFLVQKMKDYAAANQKELPGKAIFDNDPLLGVKPVMVAKNGVRYMTMTMLAEHFHLEVAEDKVLTAIMIGNKEFKGSRGELMKLMKDKRYFTAVRGNVSFFVDMNNKAFMGVRTRIMILNEVHRRPEEAISDQEAKQFIESMQADDLM